MIHLLAELYLFNEVIVQNGYEKIIPPKIDYVELFGAYLNSQVANKVLIQRDADYTEVIFGDSGILINNDNSVTVRLHSDYAISPGAVQPNIKWQSILGENFEEAIRDYRSKNVFSTEAVFFFPLFLFPVLKKVEKSWYQSLPYRLFVIKFNGKIQL